METETHPSRIASYTVERELGRGGMGVVYLARDQKLGRLVAIKALPAEFLQDPSRLARFEREARVLASLNHPNLGAIYGLEEENGARYLVLEFVEGENLSERLSRGPLPMDEALDICSQIATGMEAAHEAGVVHRDLKPSNIKITPAGNVKILDFGLAKATPETPSGADNINESPTLTFDTSKAGVVVGTAGYMSPEQARGRKVDRRTDLWALGCILFETLTGKQAFQGETISDTLAAVLRGEPEWKFLPPGTPGPVRRLLYRCLEKDPRRRLRDAADARLEIEEGLRDPSVSSGIGHPPTSIKPRWLPSRVSLLTAAGLTLGGLALGALLWALLGPGGPWSALARPEEPTTRLTLQLPSDLVSDVAGITPDGRTLVFLGRSRKDPGDMGSRMLFARHLDSYRAEPIQGTEGCAGLLSPFDGSSVAFVARTSKEGAKLKVFRVPLDGSAPPTPIADWDKSWSSGTWLPGGDLLASEKEGALFYRVSANGRSSKTTIKPECVGYAGYFSYPRPLPDDRAVLVNGIAYTPKGFQMSVGLLDLSTGKVRILVEDGGNASYSSTGHLLFARGETLFAVPFDLKRLEVEGEPVAITEGMRTETSWAPATYYLSGNGSLLYVPGGRAGARRRISFLDADGKVTPWSEDRRPFWGALAVTRDESRIAVTITNSEGIDEMWISDFKVPRLRRFLAVPNVDIDFPVWSPDGRSVAFTRRNNTALDGIYVQVAEDSAKPYRVLAAKEGGMLPTPLAWIADGSALLVGAYSENRGHLCRVAVSNPSPDAEPIDLLPSEIASAWPSLSPDGRHLAFSTNESGQHEIYVAPLETDGTLGTRVQVSTGGGFRPYWGRDGRTLYFLAEGGLQAAEIRFQPQLAATPTKFRLDLAGAGVLHYYQGLATVSGGRFLFVQRGEEEEDVTAFSIVMNLYSELRQKSPRSR